MIKEYEQFTLHDKNGNNDITAEVNWRTEDEKLNKCQVVRLTLDGERAYISKKELNAFLFVIGARNEQRKMIPMTVTKVRHYKTTVSIMLPKDAKKGTIIRGPVTITLPAVSEEIVGEVAKKAKDKYSIPRMLDEMKQKTKVEKTKEIKTTYINETKQGIKKDDSHNNN